MRQAARSLGYKGQEFMGVSVCPHRARLRVRIIDAFLEDYVTISADDASAVRFELNRVYDRWPDINEPFGGSRQSGISPSRRVPAVFLFTGESGEQYGYEDHYDESGIFHYTGEGQVGDMQMSKGNLAIARHAEDGRALHIFRSLGKSKGQMYLGEFVYVNHTHEPGPDRNGNLRQRLVFHLVG